MANVPFNGMDIEQARQLWTAELTVDVLNPCI